jgi:hypothetical protein
MLGPFQNSSRMTEAFPGAAPLPTNVSAVLQQQSARLFRLAPGVQAWPTVAHTGVRGGVPCEQCVIIIIIIIPQGKSWKAEVQADLVNSITVSGTCQPVSCKTKHH